MDRKPIFRFGNGMTKECVWTAKVNMDAGQKNGSMEVHIHDAPGQPVLISRKALRSLGAVIDFGTNEVVYRQVDACTVVPLQEAPNGHLLMPLTGNLLNGGKSRKTEFKVFTTSRDSAPLAVWTRQKVRGVKFWVADWKTSHWGLKTLSLSNVHVVS